MADTRGTFRLKEVRQDILNNEYVPIPNVWVQASLEDAGYIAGGATQPGPNISIYDKISYSTDTKSTLTAYLSGPYMGVAGASSPTAGYTMGGQLGAPSYDKKSTVDKLTFATQTTALVPGNFSDTRMYMAGGAGNSTAGYMCGGYNPSVSDIRKVTWATDTIETLPANISNPAAANYKQSTTGNADTFLYLIGGSDGSGGEVKKFTYSSESCANAPNMPSPSAYRSQRGGCTSSSLAAYIVGGANPYSSKIAKITFANDTTSTISNSTIPTPAGRIEVAGTGSPSAGYYAGGTETSYVEKITMSTEGVARIPALDLSYGIKRGEGISAKEDNRGAPNPKRWFDDASSPPNTGYSYEGSQGDTAYKTDLSSDTAATNPGAQQITDVYNQASVSSSTAGYASGGQTSSAPSTTVSITQKTTYSSDTLARLPGANLPERINYNSGISDGTAGWYWGGNKQYPTTYNWTNIYKITYATDAMSAPGAQMTAGNTQASSTNSETAGYSAGGGGDYTNVDKLVFSTEATSSLPAALPLHGNMYGTASIGTQTVGYWGGGASRTDVSKMTWVTETAALVPSGFLSQGRNYMFSLGNTTDGYFCGGAPSPARTVDKLDYSTDTSAVSPSLGPSPMRNSQQNVGMGSRAKGIPVAVPPTATPTASTTETGVAEKGYIFGGNPGPLSTIDKLDMSTETISNSSNLEENNKRMACFGNTTTAYMTGSASPVKSWIQKFVYSTDVRTMTPAALQSSRGYMSGISNNTIGYTMGGVPGPYKQQVDKFVMATETNSAIPNMPAARYRHTTWGNDTTGYAGSGAPGPKSSVSKITYSNDTQSNTSNLSRSMTFAAGVSNATTAYIVGGEQTKTAVDKWTMSSDSCSRIPGANLPASRYAWDQANNSPTKGYFVGGAPGARSNTFVLTFSSDSTALSPTCFTSTPSRSAVGAAGPNQRGNTGSNIQPNII